MKKTICCIIIPFLLCLLSCSSGKKKVEIISIDQLPEIVLEADTLGDFKGMNAPELYLIADTIIMLTDNEDGGFLRFFIMNTKNIKSYYLLKREGLIRLPKDPKINTTLEVYNSASNILFNYAIKESIFHIPQMTRMRFIEGYTPNQAVRVDKDQIACIGPYNKGLWGLFDEKYKRYRSFGNYPITEKYTPSYFHRYLDGRISHHENQLVYVCKQFGYISSYSYKKKKIKKLWEKQLSEYLYTDMGSRLVFDEKHRSGFRDVHITSDCIYALYDGYIKTDAENPERTNSLLVFDLKGKPINRYRLPVEANYIAMDSKKEYIYTSFSPEKNENYLVRFRIPK